MTMMSHFTFILRSRIPGASSMCGNLLYPCVTLQIDEHHLMYYKIWDQIVLRQAGVASPRSVSPGVRGETFPLPLQTVAQGIWVSLPKFKAGIGVVHVGLSGGTPPGIHRDRLCHLQRQPKEACEV